MSDLRGGLAPASPLHGPKSSQFMEFLGNFGKIVCWRPLPRVGAPSYGKSWIRPYRWLVLFLQTSLELNVAIIVCTKKLKVKVNLYQIVSTCDSQINFLFWFYPPLKKSCFTESPCDRVHSRYCTSDYILNVMLRSKSPKTRHLFSFLFHFFTLWEPTVLNLEIKDSKPTF